MRNYDTSKDKNVRLIVPLEQQEAENKRTVLPEPTPAERMCAPRTPLAPVQEKKVLVVAVTVKVDVAPQKEKQATAKKLAAAPLTAQAKATPIEAFGTLFGGAKPEHKTVAAPVAKAAPVPKPSAQAPPAAKKATSLYGRASSSRCTGAAEGSSA